MHERRRESRSKSYLGGRIDFIDHQSTRDCLIRNMSGSGAKLDMGDTWSAPPEFVLNVPLRGERFHARVKWRGAGEVGVVLVRQSATAGAPTRTAEPLH